MARNDIRLIIDAERKSADERIKKLEEQHKLEIETLERDMQRMKHTRTLIDWIWTVIFVAVCAGIVWVVT